MRYVLGLLAVMVLAGADAPAKYTPVPIPKKGDIRYVGTRNPDDDRKYPIFLLVDPDPDSWEHVFAAKDAAARQKNRDEGEAFPLRAGTSIQVESFPRGPKSEDFDPIAVVVLDGPEKGRRGWISAIFLVPSWPYDPSKEQPEKDFGVTTNKDGLRVIPKPKKGDIRYFAPNFDGWPLKFAAVSEPVKESFDRFTDAAIDGKVGDQEKLLEERIIAKIPLGCKMEVIEPYTPQGKPHHAGTLVEIKTGPFRGLKAYVGAGFISETPPPFPTPWNDPPTPKEKKRQQLARMKARADHERALNAIEFAKRAAFEAEYIRQNTPDYQSVQTDARGNITSIYTRMPDGSTSFATSDGYVSNSQVFRKP